jgi:hypothetical protein
MILESLVGRPAECVARFTRRVNPALPRFSMLLIGLTSLIAVN